MRRPQTVLFFVLALCCAAPAGQRSVPAPQPGPEAAFQHASAELYQAYFERVPAAPFSGTLGVALVRPSRVRTPPPSKPRTTPPRNQTQRR